MAAYREGRYTAFDGLSLFYREYGDSSRTETAALCLPGLTRNSRDFDGLATRLAATRRVICPDYRGRGRSDYDSDPGNYIPSVYLDDLRQLLAVVGCHHIVAIGTSMGGLLAMGLGAMMPSVLKAVVLNDVGPDVGGPGLARILDYIAEDRPQPNWDDAVAALRDFMPNLTLPTPADWRAAAEGTFRKGEDGLLHFDWDVRLVETLRDGPPVPDLWPVFRSLRRLPVLAVRGEVSDVLTVDTFQRMANEHPTLLRITVPGTGHTPTLVEPEVLGALDTFLKEL
jgi:pimeloyl-ACP methyl ester carboxylesterase